jgi:hypothetical protein
MICGRANAQEYTVPEVTSAPIAEEPTVVYLQHTPMEIALEWVAVVLIVLFVTASTLLACLVYPFIWLSINWRALVRHKSPVSSIETSGQKDTRRLRFECRPGFHRESS